jgi:signal transduction histidine kinase
MSGTPKIPSRSRKVNARRLWIKLLVAYLVPVTIIVTGIGYLVYRAARVAMEEQLGSSLMAIARTATSMVGKPRAVRLVPGDEESRTYANLRKKMEDLKVAAGVESIYLFDTSERALVDSDGLFSVGEPIVKLAADRVELKEVFKGVCRNSVLFTGKDGRLFKTGFAPVVIDDRVAAVVGVDGSANFFVPLADLGRTLAMAGTAALFLVLVVTLFVSRRITRPIGTLAKSARAIGRGELEREVEVETTDEIGVLAHTLNEMRKSIKERDQQLQMMLSGIAHEVRNPLGGMTLFVGLLKEDLAGKKEALAHLDRVSKELEYLSRVVNDFLDFARKRPLELEELDPEEECEQIRTLLAADLEKKELTFLSEVADNIGTVRLDRERFRQALLNLVRNAIQASRTGGRIVISVEQREGEIVISVVDEGNGIPEEKRKHVFEPFFTSRQKGTGLGLALVKNVVEAHGGTIAFTTAVERGTTFTIRIPATGRA